MAQFANTDSITATDVNNMLRGIIRDNTDNSHTGNINETALASTTVTGGTIGATGALLILAAGTVTGTNDTKTIDLQFGSSTLASFTHNAAAVNDWMFAVLMVNTTTSAQRTIIIKNVNSLSTLQTDYLATSQDTTANRTLRVTVTLANGSDSVTQTMWNVFQVNIT